MISFVWFLFGVACGVFVCGLILDKVKKEADETD